MNAFTLYAKARDTRTWTAKMGSCALPQPLMTYRFQDLYTDIIICNPKKDGSSGPRYSFNFQVPTRT